jgi:Lon protease-like protein
MIMSPKSGVPNSQIDYGTMLQIRRVQMLSDGRSFVETMGSYRFRVLERGSLDGYTVGRIERQVHCPFFITFYFFFIG